MESLKHCMLIFSSPRLAALPDRQATFVLYKLTVNQPSPQWSLFLRVRYSTLYSFLILTVIILRYTVNIRNLKRQFCLFCVSIGEHVITDITAFTLLRCMDAKLWS